MWSQLKIQTLRQINHISNTMSVCKFKVLGLDLPFRLDLMEQMWWKNWFSWYCIVFSMAAKHFRTYSLNSKSQLAHLSKVKYSVSVFPRNILPQTHLTRHVLLEHIFLEDQQFQNKISPRHNWEPNLACLTTQWTIKLTFWSPTDIFFWIYQNVI